MKKKIFSLLLVAAVSIMGAARCWPNNDDDDKKKQEQMTLAALALVASSAASSPSSTCSTNYPVADILSSGGSVSGTGTTVGPSSYAFYLPVRGIAGKQVTVTNPGGGGRQLTVCYEWDGTSDLCTAVRAAVYCPASSFAGTWSATGTFITTHNAILLINTTVTPSATVTMN